MKAAEHAAVLYRLSQEITRVSQNPEQVYRAVHAASAQLMPAEAFVIVLRDEAQAENEAVYLIDKNGRQPARQIPADQGLSGQIISRGEALMIPDFSSESFPHAVHFGAAESVGSVLAVPLRVADKVIGMISTQSYQPEAFTLEDQMLLEMLASHAATAIENARLFSETHRRLTEMEVVNKISTALRSTQTVDEMLPILLDETLAVFNTEAGSIYLYDTERDEIRKMVARGWYERIPAAPMKPNPVPAQVLASGQLYLTREFAADPLPENIRSYLPAGW